MRRASARLAGKRRNRRRGLASRRRGRGSFVARPLPVARPRRSRDPDQPRTEYFTGFEVSDNYASGYVGAGYAFGKAGYAAPGFRLRAVGAYGRYDYHGSLFLDGAAQPTTFDGQDAFAAALIGYEFRPGRLIVKLFAGVEGEDQHIVPHDPNNSVQGSALGLRLQAESWLDLSARSFRLRRRRLRHRLPGILVAGAVGVSIDAALRVGARRRRAG